MAASEKRPAADRAIPETSSQQSYADSTASDGRPPVTGGSRPQALPVRPEAIPHELTERTRWVVWIFAFRDRWTKPPRDPRTGKYADPTSPTTWGTFQEALSGYRAGRFDGIGFVFAADDPYFLIDLDQCRDDAGDVEPWAQTIVERFPIYWEVSPSGNGLRGIGRGVLPPGGNRKGPIELYDRKRFATLTGHVFQGRDEIGDDVTTELAAFHSELFSRPKPAQERPEPQPTLDSDQEVIDRCRRFANGAAFDALMRGETGLYDGDDSRADAALLERLLFASGGDIAQSLRIARTSGLRRPKWDERRDGTTYLEYSARRIRDLMSEFYESPAKVRTSWPRHGEQQGGIACQTPPEERSEPEDGAALLDDVAAYLRRFVAYPGDAACIAHSLWIAHAHLMDAWDSTPRIAFLSPEPGSGKTRALEVSELIVPRPVEAVNMSAPSLFRLVSGEDGLPTILYDECDTVFGTRKAAENNEDVRGLLNAGHRRGAKSYRCVPRGRDILVVEYEAYCAVALAGLGDLPDTILSRSVIIRMRRRAPHERVEPFRRRLEAKAGHALRDRLAAWCVAVEPTIGHPWPELPRGIEDRAADVWEPLIAIADAAGGDWPQRARAAAVALVSEARENTPSLGIRLLSDLRDIFGDADQLATEAILSRLQALPESPWAEIRNGKDPLNALGLAQRLRPYGVQSKQIRDGGKTQKGYTREALADAWLRHLSPLPENGETPETPETRPENPSNDAAIDVSLFGNVSGRPETTAQPETNSASIDADVSDVSDVSGFAEHGETVQHRRLSERLRSMPTGELTREERAALSGSSSIVPRACVDCGAPVKMRGLDRCDACVQLDYERRYGAPAGSQTEHMFAPGEPGLDRHTA